MILNRFMKDRRGAFAVQAALMAPVFALGVASAVEYSRAYSVRTEIRNALDTTTLSATRMLALEPSATDSEITSLVRRQFQATEVARDSTVTCGAPSVSIDRVNTSVGTSISCQMDTMLPAALTKFDLQRQSRSKMSFDDLDVAFMLDVSGSMGGSKLNDLKTAVKDAIDVFLNDSRSNVRIALAPYSTAVDAGAYAVAATNDDLWVRSTRSGYRRSRPGRGTKVDCVTERTQSTGHAYSDAPPSTAYLGRQAVECNRAEILPLTKNRAVLRAQVDSYRADGWTAGHLGIAWSWYLISPNWRGFWPSGSEPLQTGQGRKAVIIMTDGEFNTHYEGSNGSSSSQSAQLCNSMKAQGIVVFSVGFQAPNSVKPTLRNCATTPTYFFDSSNRTDLAAAYRSIAEELTTHLLVQ